MLAPIVIFAFNRPDHLRRTLEALAANDLAAQSDVIIFCDGPRRDEDMESVQAVRQVAHGASGFRSLTVIERGKNWGLAASVISGVTEIVEAHDRVIVVEDDLVTSPYFLRYMNESLELYADSPNVASIHGWCFPHAVDDPPETFFLRGADCWGWGTWKRAWAFFEPDANKLLERLEESALSEEFNLNGAYDYIGMLRNQIAGTISSWAVRWHAAIFLRNMHTLYPGRSLVSNIGLDGSGQHCGTDAELRSEASLSPVSIRPIPVEVNHVMREALKCAMGKGQATQSGKREHILQRLKSFAKAWLPPIVQDAIRRVRRPKKNMGTPLSSASNVWQSGYPDWQSACVAAGGYDSEAILSKVRDASRAVRDGRAVFERDSVLFDHIEYSWPLLAGLMWAAAKHGGRLRVIDFGGSLGSSCRQNRVFLNGLKEVRWSVIEQEHFVRCGQEEFQTDQLRFYTSIEACLGQENADGIMFSSVLQYIEDPYGLLEKACEYGFDFIIIDRTPFSEDADRITVQHVPESIYKASYACHFLDRRRLEAVISKKYAIMASFEDMLGGPGWGGLIAAKRQA